MPLGIILEGLCTFWSHSRSDVNLGINRLGRVEIWAWIDQRAEASGLAQDRYIKRMITTPQYADMILKAH